jgi:dTDP-4-dehydrorhamnose reductase
MTATMIAPARAAQTSTHEEPSPRRRLELWAGVEGTVNRVRDRYFDQMERSGHARRFEDLDLFAGLGIRVLRYPVLWERVAPDGTALANWRWTDRRLGRLRELGVRPIAGLLHHGSGPRCTNLLDPVFPELLAEYAGAVANRYPWLTDYTPVNEPLTTARFSALYGHWHPHAHDDRSFARALINECRGVVLSMRAIRSVNPQARLVQTDDLGCTHSTPALAYQADFENERRWITFDLLTGRLSPRSRMWGWLRAVGIDEEELEWFRANPCPPDVIGINHYLSSERFLDDRVERYPNETPGSNGQHRYVDILAALAIPGQVRGLTSLLHAAWERYHLPIAVTEAHNGGYREEQLRWLDEVWRSCTDVRGQGVDVRAVTVWSLLGAYDWGHLVTRDDGIYEPGVFDVRDGRPRPTALAGLVKSLATGAPERHPVVTTPGWWRRLASSQEGHPTQGEASQSTAPIVVLDDHGMTSKLVAEASSGESRSIRNTVIDRERAMQTRRGVERSTEWCRNAWAVIDTSVISAAERATDWRARLDLAHECKKLGVLLLMFTSNGRSETGGSDDGSSAKVASCSEEIRASEQRLLDAHPKALIVRTRSQSLIETGPADGVTFEQPAKERDPDSFRLLDIVHAALDLLIDGESGVWTPTLSGDFAWLRPDA